MRSLCKTLSAQQHKDRGRKTRVGQKLHALHGLHQPLPKKGNRVRRKEQRQAEISSRLTAKSGFDWLQNRNRNLKQNIAKISKRTVYRAFLYVSSCVFVEILFFDQFDFKTCLSVLLQIQAIFYREPLFDESRCDFTFRSLILPLASSRKSVLWTETARRDNRQDFPRRAAWRQRTLR